LIVSFLPVFVFSFLRLVHDPDTPLPFLFFWIATPIRPVDPAIFSPQHIASAPPD